MQTRAEFLAHGLAPVPTTTLSTLTAQDLDCTICAEPLSDPVQLPCQHIFDQACIAHWLEMPGKNTCPSCRRPLFSLPEPTNPVADRALLVYRAVREAGLAIDQPGDVDLFFIPQPSESMMARATPAAAQYLIYSSAPAQTPEAGLAQVDAAVLAAHVIAMGNLLPALARLQGRPYERREAEDWQTLCDRLHVVLSSEKNGRKYHVVAMARQVRQAMNLRGLILHHDVDSSGFVITDHGLSAELDTLLSYVTHVSFQQVAEQLRVRGQAARRAAAGAASVQRRVGGCPMM
ncbi:hypothetical protein LTR36_002253 [Oleoguttula mirabilis]|uniref:RING-type domain-containing protein n=1 Tax=Oleoguttula mirabilis TaxID=1507867 RepID=A0AAV9JM98_9PEZI|nr:hypothetical protein LTR36_002253 [Oleoguttula mirabilis]